MFIPIIPKTISYLREKSGSTSKLGGETQKPISSYLLYFELRLVRYLIKNNHIYTFVLTHLCPDFRNNHDNYRDREGVSALKC